jgi:hypothetical protein
MEVARALLLIVVCAAGCYAPTPAENLPCSESGECPQGQHCAPATQRCVRMVPADDGPSDAPTDAHVDTPAVTDAAIDAPLSLLFADDFERADSESIGNGWIEKTPSTFFLRAGKVVRMDGTATSYRDHLVYRPISENVLDVEVTVDVQFTALPPRFPQVFVRGVSASIGATDSYSGYLLYVNGVALANEVVLGRQEGNEFVGTLSQFTLSESFAVGPEYRMILRATGTSPVTVAARIERLVGSGSVTIGQTTVIDSSATRITEPGTVGFSGDEAASYIYDRFRRTPL